MSGNQQLVQTVKEWLSIDNSIKELQKQIKEKRSEKKELNERLLSIMNDHNLDSMNTSQGQLIKSTYKTKSALSKKHLETSLGDFFKDDPKIVEALCKHIMDTRSISVKENIRRKIKK